MRAGSTSVSYEQNDQRYPLPSGFRLFRVQAELNADGSDYVHTNSRGKTFDQLIELVDPDMDETHSATTGYAPTAYFGSGYGCILYAGSVVSPTTYPSTNFNESIVSGFTGLTFSVTASGEDSGSVTVSWSNAGRPDPADFSISLASGKLGNIGSVSFITSIGGLFRPDARQAWPYLVVDGRRVLGASTADKGSVSIAYQFNPATMTPTSVCEAVFPAGCFLLCYDGGEEVLSPEIHVPFSVSDLVSFEESGVYAESASSPWRSVGITSVLTREDGSRCYLRADGQDLYVDAIDGQDPTSVSSRRLEGAELVRSGGSNPVMNAVMLPGDRCLLAITYDGAQPDEGGRTYLVDLAAGSVVEGASAKELSSACPLLALGRTPAFSAYAYRYGINDGCVVSSVLPEGADWGGEVYVLAAGRIDPSDPEQAIREGLLAKFDASGTMVAGKPLSLVSSLQAAFSQLSVGEHGAVAVGRVDKSSVSSFERIETLLFDSSLEFAGFYDAFANSTGGWVGGRWVATSWNCETGADGEAGREDDGVRRVHYAITRVLDAGEQPDDPDTPDQPDVPSAPDAPGEDGPQPGGSAGSLASTGDAAPWVLAALCLAGAVAVASAARRPGQR